MFDAIANFLEIYFWWINGIFVFFLHLYNWTKNPSYKLWWKDSWARLPFLGTISKLSRDPTSKPNTTWKNSEVDLCEIYSEFVHKYTKEEFNKRTEYLRKSGDHGRKNTPLWAILLLGVLVVLEGLGFSLLLADTVVSESMATGNILTLIMFGLATVIGLILVRLTHATGTQIRKNSQIKSCWHKFRTSSNSTDQRPYTGAINLQMDQSKDDNEPEYTQKLNRISEGEQSAGYAMTISTLILIFGIAIFSTHMRLKNLELGLIKESTLSSQNNAQSEDPFAKFSQGVNDEMRKQNLPLELKKPQDDTDKKTQDETKQVKIEGGIAAFIILAFIFIATQGLGIYTGYEYGFNGKDSKQAQEEIFYKATYESYLRSYEKVVHIANSALRSLQQKIGSKSDKLHEFKNTFEDYLNEFKLNHK